MEFCFQCNLPSVLVEKSDLGTQQERDARTARALNMSLQYSFVTPLTSMVVTRPEASDGPLIADKLTEGEGPQLESRGISDCSGNVVKYVTCHLLFY